jgi:hypothetical protein
MHKSATKCNKTVGKWCKNKHGASKIIDTFETYQRPQRSLAAEAPQSGNIWFYLKKLTTPLVIGCSSPTERQYISFPKNYMTPLVIGCDSPIERLHLSLAAPHIQSGNKMAHTSVIDGWLLQHVSWPYLSAPFKSIGQFTTTTAP